MLSWDDVVDYIESQDDYEDVEVDGDIVDFSIDLDDQMGYGLVSLEEDETNDDAQWIRISAPIGELTPEELIDVLENVNSFFIGGVYKIEDNYFCCSSLKLSSLTEEDLDEHVFQVISAATYFINELEQDED